MTRESILKDILSIQGRNLLILAGTGIGKSYLALSKVKQVSTIRKVLIVIPKSPLIKNWKDEIVKWGYDINDFEIINYRSLHKVEGNIYGAVIYDECHHITDRCVEHIKKIKTFNNILLSATVSKTVMDRLYSTFPGMCKYKVTLTEAIDNKILSELRIILMPLHLNNTKVSCTFTKNSNREPIYDTDYRTWNNLKWSYYKLKSVSGVRVHCTQKQYYDEMASNIEYLENKFGKGSNAYLRKCGERLEWLSSIKMPFTKDLLFKLRNHRVLTFCNNIKQTELLGKHPINCKNANAESILADFNAGKIKHIEAVAMLDEGVNLTNCQIGVFSNINSSERMTLQRVGRLMRHKNPIIILPYYVHTREEEIVNKIIKDFNPKYISTATLDNLTI